jgi:hypothetical protein
MRPATRDGLNGSIAHRERRAAAGVAIHPGQDHAGERDFFGEDARRVDRVLAGHGVGHEQDLVRAGGRGHRLHLVHQRLVDRKPTGRVEQQHVIGLEPSRLQGAPGDVDGRLARHDRQRRHVRLAAEHRELLLRGGALDVQ